MDSSKHTEGCSSSESGWTMYIDSPMQEDENDCSDDDISDGTDPKVIINVDDNEQQDSDDSMASDASSGPRHHENGQRKATLRFTATKTNKKEKKNDGNSNEKNRRLTANRK